MKEYEPYGDQWKKEILRHTKSVIIDILTAQISELMRETRQINSRLRAQEEVNENMQCCGCCAHNDLNCTHTGLPAGQNHVCNYWQSDGMNKQSRASETG